MPTPEDHSAASDGGATIDADAYLAVLQPILAQVAAQSREPLAVAADLVAASLQADGVVQAFGTGHSEAFAMEVAGRAGGLVPTNRIALRDVVMIGGDAPAVLRDGTIERDPGLSVRLYELASPHPADVFVIASSSGVNGSTVELARIAKDKGHAVIAVTSLQHTERVASRHPSGLKLRDVADVVLDNGAPYGDAVLPLPGGTGSVCAVSSITAALLAQMLAAEVVARLLKHGTTPPVYLSANIPEGDEHNHALEARYAGRIRRTA